MRSVRNTVTPRFDIRGDIMSGTLTAPPARFDLRHAERLALWSLRHVLRHAPPRCTTLSRRHACDFATDLARVHARFHDATGNLGGTTPPPVQMGTCCSLSLSEDESLLLRCLARLQVGGRADDGALAAILPDRRWLAALTDALDELAAALAFGGYWLSDPECLPAVTWSNQPNFAYAPEREGHQAG
jgi:hypothetical protein